MTIRIITLAALTAAIAFTATAPVYAQVAGGPPPPVTHLKDPKPKPAPIKPDPTVCFFTGINQTGAHMCTTQRGGFQFSRNWSHKIKSVRIDLAVIRLCDGPYLEGPTCKTYSDDVDHLPPSLFNKAETVNIR